MFDTDRYHGIAKELGTSARIAAILDNLFMMFACGEIQIEAELTEALKPWVNTVNAEEAGLGGYGYEEIYVVKPEFTQHFKHDDTFTQQPRFEVGYGTLSVQSDVNQDGQVNILDLVLVSQEMGNRINAK